MVGGGSFFFFFFDCNIINLQCCVSFRCTAKCLGYTYICIYGFPGGSVGKGSACNMGDLGSIPGSGRSRGEGNGNPLQYSCLEKSHGWRSLVGSSPWGHKESDTTEQIHFHSLLGRKVMTNLHSILKSRDITMPTNVPLVKAMVFPVVMYGCESWTVKKAEC